MNIKITECKELKRHTINCLLNSFMGAAQDKVNRVLQYWNESNTIEEFKQKVLSDNDLKMTQGYAEVSKESKEHWYRVREMLGKRVFKTESDAGSVKIGTENLNVLIPNGIGDGTTRCAVFGKEDTKNFNDNMMEFIGISLDGEIEIYDYDCGINIAKKINGKFFVYVYDGLVAFVEC